MSLKDLKENLYKPKDESEKKEGSFSFGASSGEKSRVYEPTSFREEKEDKSAIWIKEDEEKKTRWKKILRNLGIGGAVALFAFALVWIAIWYRKSSFSEEKVKVSVSGPEEVMSGKVVNMAVDYQNQNRVELRNAILHINYSENFKPGQNFGCESEGPNALRCNIGTIKKNSAGQLNFSGKFFGTKDFLTYVEAKLEYSSSNFSSSFEASGKLAVLIASSPLLIEVSNPQTASSGGGVTFQVTCRNGGEETFKNLKLKAEYPQDFSFSGAEPLPAQGNNFWYVGDLEGGQSGQIKISGSLGGGAGEIKRFKFYVGEIGAGESFSSYGQNEASVKIVGSPITIKQLINGKEGEVIVGAGEGLTFNIQFRNSGEVPLRDVVLVEEMKSSILNYARFGSTGIGGAVDSGKGIVSWTPSQIEALRVLSPGEEGQISFSIPVLEMIPVQSPRDKNFSFSAVAKMDSPDVPSSESSSRIVSSNAVSVKLNSKLTMSLQGYYNDPEMANSGSLPLKVGSETTFAMRLKVGNVSNDVTSAKVKIVLAPGVKWKNNFLPKKESASYNERTNEVTWDIGSLPAGIGIITDLRELVFQIGVTPKTEQANYFVPLIARTVFTADDIFTKQALSAILEEKGSNLTEDISVGDGGKVSP